MRRKLQQSLLNNNPFPSLRKNEETFFSVLRHKENNLSDLCCLVISLFTTQLIFSLCDINTGWTRLSFSFRWGVLFPFLFDCVDCELFHQKNNRDHILEEPGTELMYWSVSDAHSHTSILGLEQEKSVASFLGRERSWLTASGSGTPSSHETQVPNVDPGSKRWSD